MLSDVRETAEELSCPRLRVSGCDWGGRGAGEKGADVLNFLVTF